MLLNDVLKSLFGAEIFFQVQERTQFSSDQLQIEPVALTHDNTFDVEPVLWTIGESLQHNQVFC